MATLLSKLQGQRVQWALDLWGAHQLLLWKSWLVGAATLHLHQQPRSAIPSRANTCTSRTTARDTPETLLSLFLAPGIGMIIFIRSCVGLLITYTIMLGDVLVGKAPEYNGFITNLANIHSGELWYLDRRFVVSQPHSCPSQQ